MALLLLLGILYSTRLVLVEVHTTIPVVRLPCAREEDPREEYHVATTGVDTNPGSADAPFLTLRFTPGFSFARSARRVVVYFCPLRGPASAAR